MTFACRKTWVAARGWGGNREDTASVALRRGLWGGESSIWPRVENFWGKLGGVDVIVAWGYRIARDCNGYQKKRAHL